MQTQQIPLQAQNKLVKCGIIGVGNIGSAHAACLYGGQVDGMELAALCDSAPAVKEACAE